MATTIRLAYALALVAQGLNFIAVGAKTAPVQTAPLQPGFCGLFSHGGVVGNDGKAMKGLPSHIAKTTEPYNPHRLPAQSLL